MDIPCYQGKQPVNEFCLCAFHIDFEGWFDDNFSGLDVEYSRVAADLLLNCLNSLAEILETAAKATAGNFTE